MHRIGKPYSLFFDLTHLSSRFVVHGKTWRYTKPGLSEENHWGVHTLDQYGYYGYLWGRQSVVSLLRCFNLPPPLEPNDLYYVCFYGVVRTLYHLLDSNAHCRIKPRAQFNLPNSQFQVGQSMIARSIWLAMPPRRLSLFRDCLFSFYISSNVKNY